MNLFEGCVCRHTGNPERTFIYRGAFQGRAKLEHCADVGVAAPRIMVALTNVFALERDQVGPAIPRSPPPSHPDFVSMKSVPYPSPDLKRSYKQPKTNMSELLAVRRALVAAADVFQWARETKDYQYESFAKLDPSEIRDAMIRHLLETGHDHTGRDEESQRLHAVHVLNNALMYLETVLRTLPPQAPGIPKA